MFEGDPPRVQSGQKAEHSAVLLGLEPTASANFAFEPERKPAANTFGGLARFMVIAPGTYQITLSEDAWVDVTQDGKHGLKSLGSTGQRGCGILRKSLRFRLAPGEVTVQVSGAVLPQLMVAFLAAY